jgi:cytosine/adenosine deaminase-related metal-dependent hydrolase
MQEVDVCISGATIITVDAQRRVINDGLIAIDKGSIVAVGKRSELGKLYKGRKSIDGSGKLVMPGLINAHLHFCTHIHKGFLPEVLAGSEWSARAFDIKEIINPEEEAWAAKAVLIETLKSGTTCFAEAGALHPDTTIEAIAGLGMRGFVGRWCSDQMSSRIGKKFGRQSEPTDLVLKENQSLLDKYKGGIADGRIQPWLNLLGSRWSSEELLKESKRMADAHKTVLNMHQTPYIEEVHRVRAQKGKRPIHWLEDLGVLGPNVLLVHMIGVDDTEIQALKRHDAKVVHCPSTALKLAYGLYAFGRFPEMMNAGVTVALGSDASECSNHHDMIRILNLPAMLFKDMRYDAVAMTAEKAIEMATINGAKALGMEDKIGSLEKGKKADMIVLDTTGPEWVPLHNVIQNLVYSATGSHVETVIVDGRVVVEKREVKTMDECEVLSRVQGLAEGLVKRTGQKTASQWTFV